MTDNLTKVQRSRLMSRVRDRDTNPEIRVRHRLFAGGLRGYRLRPRLPGKPDIAFTKTKLAIFVDGCFWHGCPKCYTRPATRKRFWDLKLYQNRARDKVVDRQLRTIGWTPLHFWEHQVKADPDKIVERVKLALQTIAEFPNTNRFRG